MYDIQKIGLDVGRGYTKAFSIHNNLMKSCKFKSNVGLGRKIDFSDFNDPIYLKVNDAPVSHFIGELSEKEGDGARQNSVDAKTNNPDVELLICAALSKVAVSNKVQIMLGVPKKLFSKKVMNEVIETYKDKTYKIQDLISKKTKTITIADIMICREGDACAYGLVSKNPELKERAFATAVLGFRTLELCYYDKGMKYNDRKSPSFEIGNITTLKFVQEHVSINRNGAKYDLEVIDSSDDFDELKKYGNQATLQKLKSNLENTWINMGEQKIFVAGGTMKNLSKLSGFDFNLVPDPQMAVAKGLYEAAKARF